MENGQKIEDIITMGDTIITEDKADLKENKTLSL